MHKNKCWIVKCRIKVSQLVHFSLKKAFKQWKTKDKHIWIHFCNILHSWWAQIILCDLRKIPFKEKGRFLRWAPTESRTSIPIILRVAFTTKNVVSIHYLEISKNTSKLFANISRHNWEKLLNECLIRNWPNYRYEVNWR